MYKHVRVYYHSRLLSTCASEELIHNHTPFPTVEGVMCTSDVSQSREGTEPREVPPDPTENFKTPSGDKQKIIPEGDPLDPFNVAWEDTEMGDLRMFITAQDFQVREMESEVCVCVRACVRACVCVLC